MTGRCSRTAASRPPLIADTLDGPGIHPRMKLLLRSSVIGTAYAICGFLLYRARVSSTIILWKSDAVVFYLPALLCIGAATASSWQRLPQGIGNLRRAVTSVGIGMATTAVFACAYCVVAFSMYGT